MDAYESINKILVHLFNDIWELEEKAVTTSMNSLVNKKYAVRHRSEEDRRIVNIQLTEKGEKAYHHHAKLSSALCRSA